MFGPRIGLIKKGPLLALIRSQLTTDLFVSLRRATSLRSFVRTDPKSNQLLHYALCSGWKKKKKKKSSSSSSWSMNMERDKTRWNHTPLRRRGTVADGFYLLATSIHAHVTHNVYVFFFFFFFSLMLAGAGLLLQRFIIRRRVVSIKYNLFVRNEGAPDVCLTTARAPCSRAKDIRYGFRSTENSYEGHARVRR